MNITFLIGNGFDIKQGLHTSYREFYTWLQAQTDDPADASAWLAFKHAIDPNHEFWADLETALGKYLKTVANDDDAKEIIETLRENLRRYIAAQDEIAKSTNTSEILNPADLHCPVSFFPEGTRRRILSTTGDIEASYVDVRVILFNYTTTFERLLDWKGDTKKYLYTPPGRSTNIPKELSAIEHIHGFCDDRGRLAVGVDNPSQIDNPDLAQSPKVCRRYVKDEFNACYELDHAAMCASWISRADIICIYGMSLGESDRRWWGHVANRLINRDSALLFYFVHRDLELRGNNGPDYQDQVDEDRQYVLDRLGITGHPKAPSVAPRIFISYSPAIFTPILPF